MVTLTEVEDEHFQGNQPGPDVDEEDFTDTGTSAAAHRMRFFFTLLIARPHL